MISHLTFGRGLAFSRGAGAYLIATLMVMASTLLGLAVAPRWGTSAVDLLYLPAVLGAAVLGGFRPALLAVIGSTLAYNFFFTAPYHTLHIDQPADLVTVAVLFLVALVASQLAASVRAQARIAAAHSARNATIAGLSHQLLSCASEGEIAAVATREIAGLFRCSAVLVTATPTPKLIAAAPAAAHLASSDMAAAVHTLRTGQPAGRGVPSSLAAEWQFHAVGSLARTTAAMGLASDEDLHSVGFEQRSLLESLLDQIALALERSQLENQTRNLTAVRERERIKSALLSTIGDDLTPRLTSIIDTARELRRSRLEGKRLVASIESEATKLYRYVADLVELGVDTDHQPIQTGEITIDLFKRTVRRADQDIHLTPKEYAVLAELAKQPGRVLTHAHLLRAAWGPAHQAQTEYLRVAVRGLRQKLESNPSQPVLIVNAPAVGYRLVA